MPADYGLLQVAPNRISGSLSMATPRVDDTTQKAAAGVASAANDFLKELIDQANKTRVQDAINQYTEDLDHYKYDKDTGMMRRKGRDVALPESGEAFSVEGERGVEERIGKYFGGLNQAQQELAKDFLSRTRASNRNEFLRHEAQECDNYTVDVSEAGIKRARNSLAQNGMHPEVRAADIQTIRDSYAAIGKIRGWSDEHVKNSSDEAISGALKDVIGVLLDDGNISAATKLFNESGRGGNLLGRDMIQLRKRINRMRQAAAQKAAAQADARRLITEATPELSMDKAIREAGISAPGLEKAIKGITDPEELLRAKQKYFGKVLHDAGGDMRTAMWIVAGYDPNTVYDNADVETIKAVEKAAKAADGAPTYAVPSVSELYGRMRREHPELTDMQAMKRAQEVGKILGARAQLQSLEADAQLGRALQALDAGADFDSVDTSLLTGPMLKAVEARARKVMAGTTSVGDDATFYAVKAHPEQLAKMTEAQVRAALASCSDAQIAAALQLRQTIAANGGKIEYTKTARIRQAFDLELRRAGSALLDSKNKAQYEQRVDLIAQRVASLEREAGKGIDDASLNAIVLKMAQQPMFYSDGPTYVSADQIDFSREPEVEQTLDRFCRQHQSVAAPTPDHYANALWQITSANPAYQMTIREAKALLPVWYWDTYLDKLYGDRLEQPNGLVLVSDFLRETMDSKSYSAKRERAPYVVAERERQAARMRELEQKANGD